MDGGDALSASGPDITGTESVTVAGGGVCAQAYPAASRNHTMVGLKSRCRTIVPPGSRATGSFIKIRDFHWDGVKRSTVEVRKQFFFEKKNQKTFESWAEPIRRDSIKHPKVFCCFFSKKKFLLSF
jgi:hypothetical protein